MPTTHPRISARLSAIAESATLAVDAKAKALKAAGRPVYQLPALSEGIDLGSLYELAGLLAGQGMT